MCLPAQPHAPDAAATGLAERAGTFLAALAAADASTLTAAEQAECLLRLEQAESRLIAARATMLAAFEAQRGYELDGQASAQTWLAWQARITRPAAAAAVRWARRLAAHPQIKAALSAGSISASWARQICDWVELLPSQHREDAEVILLGAAAAGADLAGLAVLAEEMRRRTAEPDRDDDNFADRWLRLDKHWRGAARLDGELTPQAASALAAVLDALGKKAGPEDIRTKAQRDHDALEEACRRLIGTGCLPERAGQATQIQLHMTLDQLRGMAASSDQDGHEPSQYETRDRGTSRPDTDDPATDDPATDDPATDDPATHDPATHDPATHDPATAAAVKRWRAIEPRDQGAGPVAGLPPAGPGDDCDAAIVPVITGHVDPAVLDRLTRARLKNTSPAGPTGAGLELLSDTIVRYAADLLSGPTGLAAWLRSETLTGPAAAISLPLDIGTATDTVPPHLRRAMTVRDRGCRFPGCDQPPAACHPHHIIPRASSGPTSLGNLLSLCSFHHLIAVHRWGWTITLHGDGTVTATSPDRLRVLNGHGPPCRAA